MYATHRQCCSPARPPSELRPRAFASFLAAFLAAVVIALTAVGPAHAQGSWQQTEFVIGSWNDPLLGVEFYQQARDAGFNLLTGTVYHTFQGQWGDCCYSQGYVPAILSAAAQAGLKALIVDPHYAGPFFSTAPTFNPAVPPHVFELYDAAGGNALTPEQNDALWGYMMWDEPLWNTTNETWLKSWASVMHQNDIDRGDGHGRAVYLNFQPGCAPIPCWETVVNQFVNDPDAARRVDVASFTNYPFWGSTTNPIISTNYFRPMRQLHAAMGARPFWVVTYAGSDVAGPNDMSDPDENQLRFMAYAPAAAGAKGIVWFLYRSDFEGSQDAVVSFGGIPNCKYAALSRINLYLRDVVAGVAMNSTHLGIFHQSSAPSGEGDLEPMSQAPAVQGLGNPNFCVGVFCPTATPADTFLFVVNKALSPQSGTVTLRQSRTVTQSPIAATFAGGVGYTPLTTGTTFAVSLLGGEGRMFRLTGAPTPDIALTSPLGGEEWLAGQSRLVTWQGNGNPVDLTLYPDTKNIEAESPIVPLATGLTGGSANLTMPAGTFTRRARLVLESAAPGGEWRRVTNASSFSTAPGPSLTGTYWSFGSGHCFSSTSLALGADGLPRLAYYNLDNRMLYFTQFDGCSWSGAAFYPGLTMNVSTVVDALQRPRVAFYYNSQLYVQGGEVRQTVRRPNGTWATSTVSELDPVVGPLGGGLAMAPTADGEVVVAYSTAAGPAGRLKLYKSTTDPVTLATTWQPFNPTLNLWQENPRSISMAVDPSGAVWVACISTWIQSQAAMSVNRITPTTNQLSAIYTGDYRHVALALAGAGLPRIVYASEAVGGAGDLLLTRAYNGTSWSSTQQVDMTGKRISDLKLAMEAGAPRAIYSANGVVKLASLNGSTWSFDTVEYPHDQDGPVSLAYATGGERWTGYFDRDLDQVRVAEHHVDTTPPATTSSLYIAGFTTGPNAVKLMWAAPGDDGTTGRAKSYSIRMRSGSEITETNWPSASEVSGAPSPSAAGAIDSVTVSGLSSGVLWYFALKATDNGCNTSGLSNNDCILFGNPSQLCTGEGGSSAAPAREEAASAPPRELAIRVVSPNPASHGRADIHFTLADGAPASLEVLDVAGRRVESHNLAGFGPGDHMVRIGTRAKLSPGVYWVRVTQGDRSVKRGAIVVR